MPRLRFAPETYYRVEAQLAANAAPLRASVLKAPRHGRCTSSSESSLTSVDPQALSSRILSISML